MISFGTQSSSFDINKFHDISVIWWSGKVAGSIPTVVRQNFRLPSVDILGEASSIYTLHVIAIFSHFNAMPPFSPKLNADLSPGFALCADQINKHFYRLSIPALRFPILCGS